VCVLCFVCGYVCFCVFVCFFGCLLFVVCFVLVFVFVFVFLLLFVCFVLILFVMIQHSPFGQVCHHPSKLFPVLGHVERKCSLR
jgi:hypothetical protein